MIGGRVKKRARALWMALLSMFTIGRVLTLLYAAIIVAIAHWFILESIAPEITAARYLKPNTRIVAELLSKPTVNWFGDSTQLNRKLEAMQGRYLTSAVLMGAPVTQSALRAWPTVSVPESIVVEFDVEPDYSTLNAGTIVQLTAGEKSPSAEVLSIVPSGSKKWLAYLRKSDLVGVISADLHDVTFHVLSLPEEPPRASKK